jgi:predicted transposase/invertase (TIGR01784 family)
MHNAHDHSYKLLFSNPQLVIDLLKGFVHEDWVDELNFNTLEPVKQSHTCDDLREREDDIIWRVRHQQRWVYIYLLIEFQSTIDPFMAVRVPLYTLLLYQDLIRAEKLTKGDQLPPVFPVVLYNGNQRWNSATQLSDLIVEMPGGLERYRLNFEYLILDEGAYQQSELEGLKNFVAAIFRLENAQNRNDIIKVIDSLQQWLDNPEMDRIKQSFVIWMKRVLLPAKKIAEPIQQINDLTEIKAMLAQTVSKMTAEWVQQGRIEGRVEGRVEGEIKGEKNLLLRLINHRFDELIASKALSIITPIDSLDTLETISNWVLDSKNGEDFLNLLDGLL